MGLLDDAIREHLELKRRHGADPGLVAREESEAFGPVRGGEPADADDAVEAVGSLAGGRAEEGGAPRDDNHTRRARSDDADDFSSVGQETVELDMRTVLDEDPDHVAATTGPIAGGSAGSRHATDDRRSEHDTGDSLDWEMPGDHQSRDAVGPFDADGRVEKAGDRSDGPVEDALGETSNLTHTPGQERLWFEQRPPGDLDFDK
jgi:hypothetical protein